MTPTDPRAFGRAIGDLRRGKGILRKEIVARLDGLYSDESSYGRVEQGRRSPDRDNVLAILVRGLQITESEAINGLLALAGFDGLSPAEAQRFKVEKSEISAAKSITIATASRNSQLPSWRTASLVSGVLLVLALLIGSRLGSHNAVVLITSILYAGLYSESLLLESAFLPDRQKILPVATVLFSFVLVTSLLAFAVDAALIDAGDASGLAYSSAILLGAAILQWFFFSRFLPKYTLFRARFQLLSSEAAHLKNTGYFLLLVFIFWLPPFHAILSMEHAAGSGTQPIRQVLAQQIMIGHGVIALNAGPLTGILVLMILISIPMGAHLLDNLRPHPSLGAFHVLFYLRAILYFSLCVICVGWYFYSIGQLN